MQFLGLDGQGLIMQFEIFFHTLNNVMIIMIVSNIGQLDLLASPRILNGYKESEY